LLICELATAETSHHRLHDPPSQETPPQQRDADRTEEGRETQGISGDHGPVT
jgi:hypothetical protein